MTTDKPDDRSPTDDDLAGLINAIAQPAAQLLQSMSTAVVALLRGMLDEAYARGRADAEAARRTRAAGSGANPNVVVTVTGPAAGSPSAVLAAHARRTRMQA
jgi:hypothetical protein